MFVFKLLLTFHIKSLNLHKKSNKYHQKYVSKVKILEEINFVPTPLSINIALKKKVEQVLLPFTAYSFKKELVFSVSY